MPDRPERRRLRYGALVGLAAACALACALAVGWLKLPDDYNPWAQLDPTAPPNVLTSIKLRRAREDMEQCRAALDRLDANYTPVPDRMTGEGCGFRSAVRLEALGTLKLGPPVVLSCRTALSLAMWERHSVQPAARTHLGSEIVSMQNLGSYACRNVNTGEPAPADARRSRHATADAIDIAALTPRVGRRITIVGDWVDDDAAPSRDAPAFLRDVHAGACRFFDGVLGPDYNAVHRDHFHLETGGWKTCR